MGPGMPKADLVDNDVVFKLSCFDLGTQFQGTFDGRTKPYRLGLAQFVLPKRIIRSSRVRDKDAALRNHRCFAGLGCRRQPTDDEINLAADIEELARTGNFAFDSGESQLLAVLLTRGSERLYTGDKRAIVALRGIAFALSRENDVAGRVVCFETGSTNARGAGREGTSGPGVPRSGSRQDRGHLLWMRKRWRRQGEHHRRASELHRSFAGAQRGWAIGVG